MFCSTAQSCPTLLAPANGILVCSGPQVTGVNCSVSCDGGHYLEGSALRSCLPNNTWSGVASGCHPLLCDPLKPSNITAIVPPCHNEYKATCTLACVRGYTTAHGSVYQQTCSLASDGSTEWTTPPICQGNTVEEL